MRPKENELIAVPVTKLYDLGATVAPSKLLAQRIGEASVALNPVTAAKIGLVNGGQATVSLNGISAAVKIRFDASISTGVALIPRSFGIPISAPTTVTITAAGQGGNA